MGTHRPKLGPLLPERRIAAAVEASDDNERFVSLDDEDECIGKVAKQGAARACGVKITGNIMGNAAQARPSKPSR